jgi:hypothetical protein
MRARTGLKRVESARGTRRAKPAREHAIALRDEESHHRGRQRLEWQAWQLSQIYITCRSQTLFSASWLLLPVDGTLTGRGADLIIVDDPLKAEEAMSEAARNRVIEWYAGTLVSRLNDK